MNEIVNIIIEEVVKVTGVSDILRTTCRKHNVVSAKAIAINIIREKTMFGENDIAEIFNRSGASIHHLIVTFKYRYAYERSFRETYDICMRLVEERILEL